MTFAPSRILVPVAVGFDDDLRLAEQLVDAACDLARGPEPELTLLFVHAVRLPFVGVDSGLTPPIYYEQMAALGEADKQSARERLDALAARAAARKIKAKTEVRAPLEGVGEAIAHAARDQKPDLIVLWSHGRRGLKRFLLGSVAERVAHLAPVSLLILRTPLAE